MWSFYQIEVQVITNPSSRLEKLQMCEFLFMTDFLRFFFKKAHFPHVSCFSKIIVCVLFHVNLFDRAHYSLISPFPTDNFFFKSGVHFWF